MSYLIVALFFIVVFALINLIANRTMRKVEANVTSCYETLATRLGGEVILGSDRDEHKVIATVDGFDIVLDRYYHSGQNETWYRINIALPHIDYPMLRIQFRQAIISAIAKLIEPVGGEEIKIGDTEFDDTFIINTDSPDATRSLLSPTLIAHHLKHKTTNISWKKHQLELEGHYTPTNPDVLQELILLTVAYAKAIQDHKPRQLT